MVDDATGITLALMAEGETTRVVFEALKAWIKKYGVPLALCRFKKCLHCS
jgi:hypothetical protein